MGARTYVVYGYVSSFNNRGAGVLMEGVFLKKIVHTIQDTTGEKVGKVLCSSTIKSETLYQIFGLHNYTLLHAAVSLCGVSHRVQTRLPAEV